MPNHHYSVKEQKDYSINAHLVHFYTDQQMSHTPGADLSHHEAGTVDATGETCQQAPSVHSHTVTKKTKGD